ncbi:Dna Topoisomerase 2-Beta, partial [Manis pentadactyla]
GTGGPVCVEAGGGEGRTLSRKRSRGPGTRRDKARQVNRSKRLPIQSALLRLPFGI